MARNGRFSGQFRQYTPRDWSDMYADAANQVRQAADGRTDEQASDYRRAATRFGQFSRGWARKARRQEREVAA